MKYLVAALLSWTGAQAAPPPQAPPPAQQPPALRQALEQYHPGGSAAPRQLSPSERAELRRQLSEYAPPPNPAVQGGAYQTMPSFRRR